ANPPPTPSPAREGAARSRIALFREREDAIVSAARLRRFGFSVVCLPVFEIRTRSVRPQRSRYDAVVATSDKAFHADGASDTSSPLYVVGARTGHAAEARAAWTPAEARSLASCVAALHYSRRSAQLAARLAETAGVEACFLK